jgi:hypothetical protein
MRRVIDHEDSHLRRRGSRLKCGSILQVETPLRDYEGELGFAADICDLRGCTIKMARTAG